jgi:predicted RNA binding protein YcfA (HicA-like mRNA interferase family)
MSVDELTYGDVQRYLESLGFQSHRVPASHIVFRHHASGTILLLALHDETDVASTRDVMRIVRSLRERGLEPSVLVSALTTSSEQRETPARAESPMAAAEPATASAQFTRRRREGRRWIVETAGSALMRFVRFLADAPRPALHAMSAGQRTSVVEAGSVTFEGLGFVSGQDTMVLELRLFWGVPLEAVRLQAILREQGRPVSQQEPVQLLLRKGTRTVATLDLGMGGLFQSGAGGRETGSIALGAGLYEIALRQDGEAAREVRLEAIDLLACAERLAAGAGDA